MEALDRPDGRTYAAAMTHLEAASPAGSPAGSVVTGSRLERWIGRPATRWGIDDLVRVFHERQLQLLALMHVGGDGELKTLDFAPRNVDHLRRVLETGERADGSSLFPGLGITSSASDVFLRPGWPPRSSIRSRRCPRWR